MSRRRTISVHDYPEHLNPFSEIHEADPEPFKFHTVGRRKRRPSLSNAWNLFASRKTKPVEASLNLSPRLPRTSSLANNEFQDDSPSSTSTRRKMFSDLSWLPGRKRFGSASQQSSPTTPRKNTSAYPEYATMQRYRSISLSRTSENTVYRPGETPLITPRTHRYRSPSLSPGVDDPYRTANDPYKTVSGYPTANDPFRTVSGYPTTNGEGRYSPEHPPRRARSSSLSPAVNGHPYNTTTSTRLYIDESQSTQALERLQIEEASDRRSVNRRLFPEDGPSPSRAHNGDSRLAGPSTIDSEPLVPQRPPRPPRTKKRRAPLPPLPQFARTRQSSPGPGDSSLSESSPPQNASEEKSNVTENQAHNSEELRKVIEPPAEFTEPQVEATERTVAEEPTATSEQPQNVVELRTNISIRQSPTLEQQTNTYEQPTNVAEQPSSTSELPSNASETPSEQDEDPSMLEPHTRASDTPSEQTGYPSMPEPRTSYSEDDVHSEQVLTVAELQTSISQLLSRVSEMTGEETDVPRDRVHQESDSEDSLERNVRKPETKVRTKFGVCDLPRQENSP